MYFLAKPKSEESQLTESLNEILGTADSGVVIIIDNDLRTESISYFDQQIAQMQVQKELHHHVIVYHLNSVLRDFKHYSLQNMQGEYYIESIPALDLENVKRYLRNNELCGEDEIRQIRELQGRLKKS